jgi:hypothetical protein
MAVGDGNAGRGTGEVIAAHSEQSVFELCDVPYLRPKDR